MLSRKNLRIKGYDYKSTGYYFVTICTENRLQLFGNIINGLMNLNDAGKMVHRIIANISNYYPNVCTDTFIVMPDHIHAVLVLTNRGRTQRSAPTDVGIPELVKNIKTYTTRNYIHGVRINKWQPFCKQLWQRGYYEHIIRNPEDLNKIREYIINNPMAWYLNKKINALETR